MFKRPAFLNTIDGFRRVKKGSFAFYCDRATALAIIPKLFEPHEICDTREVIFRKDYFVGIIVKKLSPLRERLLINWIRMREDGTVQKIAVHWNGASLQCTSTAYFESVRIEYVAPVFMFLVSVQVLCACILLCEICARRCGISYRRQNVKLTLDKMPKRIC